MKSLALAAAILLSTAANAVAIENNCEGLWAGTKAVLKAAAKVSGEYSPKKSNAYVQLELETGGKFTGFFEGDAWNLTGKVTNEKGPRQYPGYLTRFVDIDRKRIGFRFRSGDIDMLLLCE